MKQQKIEKIYKSSTSLKFAKNSIYNVIGFVVTIPILILLTPYMLKVLGKAQFGIWAIAGVVTSYAQLSDLGMTTAIVKFVAEHWVKKELENINRIVSTTFYSFAILGGGIISSIIFLRFYIVVDLLKVPLEMQHEALFVIVGVAIIFYFNLLFSVYNSVLLGIQRMDVTNVIMIFSKIFRALGMLAFLAAGMGLRGLIWNSALFSTLTIIANVVGTKLILPKFRIQLKLVSYKDLKYIFRYSINILFAKLTGFFEIPINKLILSSYTSLTLVSFYEIGCRIQAIISSLIGVALTPLLPASSELQNSGSKMQLEQIYFTVSRILFLYAVPIFVLIITMAKPLTLVWLGDGYDLAAYSIQLLLIAYISNALVTPQYVILQGTGRPEINTVNHLIAGIGNIIISIILTIKIGFWGVLFGLLFSTIVADLFLVVSFHRITKIRWKSYLKRMPFSAVIFCLLVGILVTYLKHFVHHWDLFTLVIFFIIYIFSYVFILIIFKIITFDDKKIVNGLFELIRSEKMN